MPQASRGLAGRTLLRTGLLAGAGIAVAGIASQVLAGVAREDAVRWEVLVLASAGLLAAGWAAHAALLGRQVEAARRDPLTGLPARAAWTRQAHKLAQAGACTVLLVDLDRFKKVNDTFGHAAGDRVLEVTAARLHAWTGQVGGGACGRLGGDEFAVIVRSTPRSSNMDTLVAQLASAVTLPDGRAVIVGASAGAAACPRRGALPAALGAADAAMYQAKQSGGGWRLGFATGVPESAPAHRTRHHGSGAGGHLDDRAACEDHDRA